MSSLWGNIDFVHPEAFLLLLLIPLLGLWYFLRLRKRQTYLTISDSTPIKKLSTWRTILYPYLPILRVFSLAFIIIALARPQLTLKEEEIKAEGIDIILVMDRKSNTI